MAHQLTVLIYRSDPEMQRGILDLVAKAKVQAESTEFPNLVVCLVVAQPNKLASSTCFLLTATTLQCASTTESAMLPSVQHNSVQDNPADA